MNDIRLRLSFLFVLLVLLQVCLFNQIHLFGVATPLLYLYFILKLPVEMNRNLVLVLSFLMGSIIDFFTYTWGIHMLSMTIVGFLRHYILPLFTPRDTFENFMPAFSTFSIGKFMGYAASLTIVHHILVFSLELFSLFDPVILLLKIGSSILLTLLLIFAFESLNLASTKR